MKTHANIKRTSQSTLHLRDGRQQRWPAELAYAIWLAVPTVSERNVQRGLRTTLLTQAKRLERLADQRLKDFPKGTDGEIED
jgi:hypothetical protein